jgi:RimJ/RimL family protein N-acetyltransferase
MQDLHTERLFITSLNATHSEFIIELLNSAGWLKFIGERNIKTSADAENYINKINNAENLTYWVAKLKETNTPIGIVTLIKRDYLDHHDIGFAFLPQYAKQGLALEATKAVLADVMQKQPFEKILATTIPENVSSINLLQKLGLQFQEEIVPDGTKLQVFAAQRDKLILS